MVEDSDDGIDNDCDRITDEYETFGTDTGIPTWLIRNCDNLGAPWGNPSLPLF